MDNSGLYPYSMKLVQSKLNRKGKNYAKNQVNVKKYYGGSEGDLSQDDDKIIGIVVQILQFGSFISVTALVCEFMTCKLLSPKRKDSIVMADFKIRMEVHVPTFYSRDFKETSLTVMPLKHIVMVRCNSSSHRC